MFHFGFSFIKFIKKERKTETRPVCIDYYNLQFQSQRPMLRRVNNLKNNKYEQRNQKSQDNKALRSRKQDSPSPIIKQININKQNIHPNKVDPKPERENQKYKEIYYNIKQHNANSKQEKYKTQQPSITTPPQNIPNFHYIFPCKEIEIKITNRSLEKCQVHPQSKSSPKAVFFIDQTDKGQILCCGSCSHQFQNKIPIQKISDSFIVPGVTIKQYYQVLNEKLNNLQKIQQNIAIYEKQFRQMCTNQCQKHRKHYNQLLQIIQIQMKQSQSKMSKYIGEGQKKLTQKKEQVSAQLSFVKQQLKKLLQFQQNQYKGRQTLPRLIQFNFQQAYKNISVDLKIPAIHLYTNLSGVYSSFQKIFRQNYGLQLLTQEELLLQEKKDKQNKQTQRITSHLSSNQSYKTTMRQQSDSDFLYCDEDIGDRTNKTHEFSFDQSNEEDSLGNKNRNDCIIELVEEEQVISPVFKAI